MTRDLVVELNERTYPIRIGANRREALRETLQALATDGRALAVVTDERVAAAQARFLEESLGGFPRLVLSAGERTKSVAQLEAVYDFLAAHRMERGSLLVVFGGGVIGDLGGFAAATYLRGIEYIQIPTTLLAMVDSSVGGKTGINLKAGKNLAGAFHHPREVLIDTELLRTLPPREFGAGMAEVIKYGMLADAALFRRLGEGEPLHAGAETLPEVIRRCCEIKAEIVSADERERAASGGRALLNLGHTFAHAVEQVAGYGEYLHGEAVGLGLLMAARLSEERGKISAGEVAEVRERIGRYGLPVRLHRPLSVERLLAAMRRDKKVRGGALRFIGMEALGRAATWEDVGEEHVVALWREFGAEVGS